MHLNWKTGVALPVHRDGEMTAAVQEKVSAATDDDLLASLLHFLEGRVALSLYRDFDDLLFVLRREESHAEKLVGDDDSHLCFEYRQANYRLQRDLRTEAVEAERIRDEAGGLWHSLREATTKDLNHRYRPAADPAESGLEAIGPQMRALDAMWGRLIDILWQYRDEMHDLALKDAEFRAFAATSASIDLEQFDGMAPLEFEQAVADLVQRDGHTVSQRHGGARDLGADVIASTPDGCKIVFQCKHRRPRGRIQL
ncbi:restriction endonuclease [Streptomyces sp. NPDC051776]|uniref:restriction endonuclease n=1 Tax=Streptomyces sp. NPDC051776 TaxID=3155414 RepID=UPI003439D139